MNEPCPARYYDGAALAARPVLVATTPDGTLQITGENIAMTIPLPAAAAASSRIGSIPRFVPLPDGGRLALPVDENLDAVLDRTSAPSRYARLLHRLESRVQVAAAALVLVVAIVAGSIWLGLPALARQLAAATPAELEAQAGRAAFAIFDRQIGGGTGLPLIRQRRARAIFQRMVEAKQLPGEPTLVFRALNVPNAFAFPGGIIVISDSLVELTLAEPGGEDVLAAVFAHELAHVERRHGLQLVLRNSAALVAVATITGDLSTLTAFSSTLPFLLIQRGYARDFEREADLDAQALLRKAGINPDAMPRALELLEKQRPGGDAADFTYLSTHPSTEDRVRSLRATK